MPSQCTQPDFVERELAIAVAATVKLADKNK
jgi:hypothetical protein